MTEGPDAVHVRNLMDAALAAFTRGASQEALRVSLAAVALARATGAHRAHAEAAAFAARLLHAGVDFEAARASFREAATAWRAVGERALALRADLSVAFIAYDAGDARSAHAGLDAAEADARAQGVHDQLRAQLCGYRGNLARQAGDWSLARQYYQEAIAAAAAVNDANYARVFSMDDAITCLLQGDNAAAIAQLMTVREQTRALPSGLVKLLTSSVVEHYVAIAQLLVGLPVLTASEALVLPSLQGARDVVGDRSHVPSLSALESLPRQTEHARLSARLLLRLTENTPQNPRILVARDGTKLVRGGEVVELTRRASLRRILAALAAAAAQGQAKVPSDALIRAGWPDEKVLPAAAKNRLYVALNTLRRLGLDVALRAVDEGYALDADRCVIVGAL